MRLQHKRGLIIGIANENSIAFGCARVMREQGAELALTYLNEKAEPYVRPLAQRLDSRLVVPCDVREPGRLEDVFARIAQEWGSSTSCCTRSHTRRRRTCIAA
ncbi:hypothetical protein BMMON2_19050 [Burkholderia mallei]